MNMIDFVWVEKNLPVQLKAAVHGPRPERHVATVRCKRTGQKYRMLESGFIDSAGYHPFAIYCERMSSDDDNIIDPYGSGPVPIEPIRIKTPSHTLDGVKTGLVVGR